MPQKKIGRLKKHGAPQSKIPQLPNCEGCTVELCTIPDLDGTRERCWNTMKHYGWINRER